VLLRKLGKNAFPVSLSVLLRCEQRTKAVQIPCELQSHQLQVFCCGLLLSFGFSHPNSFAHCSIIALKYLQIISNKLRLKNCDNGNYFSALILKISSQYFKIFSSNSSSDQHLLLSCIGVSVLL